MNIVEMQPSVLPPPFPLSDARPASSLYLDQPSQYADSRQSPKYNTTPPSPHRQQHIPLSPPSSQETVTESNSQPSKPSLSPQSAVAGKKRSANGAVKEVHEDATPRKIGHARTSSTASNGSMTEVRKPEAKPSVSTDMQQLSQQLRTRLTYAMIKVQNGWQNRCLDEVESLASASPRSTNFNHYSDNRHMLSPRQAMTAHLSRQSSDSSDKSARSEPQIRANPMLMSPPTSQTRSGPTLMSPPASKKSLAPPANIVSRSSEQRRRPTPNMQLQSKALRPAAAQRTPSQNRILEADAVETLLFMASPNNSGKASQFSPVKRDFAASQTSPLRNTFSAPTSPKRVDFAFDARYSLPAAHDKKAIIAEMIERMDEDGDAALDEALQLMDRHHAAKVAT